MTLAEGLPYFNMFYRKLVYMRARVTLGVGLPYQTDRVTLAAGPSFCLHKPSGSCFIRPTVTDKQGWRR